MADPINHRFRDIGGMIAELIASDMSLHYDPTTGGARALFNGKLFLPVGTTYQPLGDHMETLEVVLSDIFARTFEAGDDPITGTDLSTVSIAGLMKIIKKSYDEFVNERIQALLDAEAENPTEPEPEPEPGL